MGNLILDLAGTTKNPLKIGAYTLTLAGNLSITGNNVTIAAGASPRTLTLSTNVTLDQELSSTGGGPTFLTLNIRDAGAPSFTIGPTTAYNNADTVLSYIKFFGKHGADAIQEVASIRCYTDAACGSSDHPSRISFWTCIDGTTSVTEKLRIGNSGLVNILTASALGLIDTNASHYLRLSCGSDITADRILTFTPGDAARTITLSGNPTLADWFDQSVKAAATPVFAGLTVRDMAILGTGSGLYNSIIGTNAGINLTGNYNVVLGYGAGRYHYDGSTSLVGAVNSIYIGALCRGLNNTDDNSIVIGYGVNGGGANTVSIGNQYITHNFFQGEIDAAYVHVIACKLYEQNVPAQQTLDLVSGESLSADRAFYFITGDSDRTLTLSGNPTLGDWFDQSVKSGASPTFAAITNNQIRNSMASAYLSADQGSVTDAAWVKVNLNAENFDIGGNFDTTNKRYVAPVTGYYQVSWSLGFYYGSYNFKVISSGIYVNGALVAQGTQLQPWGVATNYTPYAILGGARLLYAVAGQYIELYGYADVASGTGTFDGDAYNTTHMTVYLVSI